MSHYPDYISPKVIVYDIGFVFQIKSEVKNMDENMETTDEKDLKIIEKLKILVEKEPEDEKDKKREKTGSV